MKFLLGLTCVLFVTFFWLQTFIPRDFIVNVSNIILPEHTNSVPNSGLPSRLTIPSLSIAVPVIPSSIENGKWQVTSKGVSVVNSTDIFEDTTGLVMYGHNWPSILEKLQGIEAGDTILLTYDTRDEVSVNQDEQNVTKQPFTEKKYIVVSKKIVAAGDIQSIFVETPGSLVVYTCIGFLDRQRLIVVAEAQF